MTAQARHVVSPMPICPDPRCGKVWAPDRRTAKTLRQEMIQLTGHAEPVRYYQHAGGWHWTRQTTRTPRERT